MARQTYILQRVGLPGGLLLPDIRFATVRVGSAYGGLILEGPTISPLHAFFIFKNNVWHVVDHKSENGVHVKSNGTSRRIAPVTMTPLNIGDEITFGPEVVEPKDGFVFKLFSMVHMEPRPRTPTYENGEPIEEIMIRWNNQMESRPCTPTYENETPKEEIVP